MDTESRLAIAAKLLEPWAAAAVRPGPGRMDVPLPAKELTAALTRLTEAPWGYLSTITGLHHPAGAPRAGEAAGSAEQLEALYHFVDGAAVLTLRVAVPLEAPVLPSVCALVPTAVLYERELEEMLGFQVAGTPMKEAFLLPEDWPAGVFPLRKSFTGLPAGQA